MREIEEVWKPIEGYDYMVSNLGRVKSLGRWVNCRGGSMRFKKESILKPKKTKKGYLVVDLYKDGKDNFFSVHRLVANAFIPNPENLEDINHIDEDKTNNRVDNLEWMTHKDNKRYSSAKAVNQFSLDGKFIRRWDCMREIQYQLGFNQSNIWYCCQDRRRSAYGYLWRYA